MVIVVSEERGEMTFVREGRAALMSSQEALLSQLRTIVPAEADRRKARLTHRTSELGMVGAALGLSAVIWSVTFLLPGRTVRMQAVPIEFSDVPAGLTIASQSATAIQVWVRASDFVFDSFNLGELVARCDLATARAGNNVVHLDSSAIDVPPGIKVESWTPRELNVRLESAAPAPRPH
jgi:hypothetical protein